MLSRIPRTHLSIAGHRHGAFYVAGWSGFWLAVALTLSLAAVRGRSVLLQAGIAAAAAAVYFSIVALVGHRTGRETLVYYHHILVFLAVARGRSPPSPVSRCCRIWTSPCAGWPCSPR